METCRMCLKTPISEAVRLFSTEDGSSSLADLVLELLGIEILDMDQWPSRACLDCISFIHQIQKFHAKILTSHEILYSRMVVKQEDSIETKEQVMNAQTDDSALESQNDEEEVIIEESVLETIPTSTEAIIKEEEDSHVAAEDETVPDDPLGIYEDDAIKDVTALKMIRYQLSRFSDEDRLTVSKMRQQNLFVCKVCNANCSSIIALRYHVRQSHGEHTEYLICCDISLWQHYRLIFEHFTWHNDNEAFKCTDCGHCAADSRQLHRHRKMQHDSCYLCKYCGARYRSLYHYQDHVDIHIAVQYQCPKCKSQFRKKNALELHMEKKHANKDGHQSDATGDAALPTGGMKRKRPRGKNE